VDFKEKIFSPISNKHAMCILWELMPYPAVIGLTAWKGNVSVWSDMVHEWKDVGHSERGTEFEQVLRWLCQPA
jgi:hypothetical protein